jgi:hypothetical protein
VTGRQAINDSRTAIATACVRVSASSFFIARRMYVRTVSAEMESVPAISSFDFPAASRRRMSRSRDERPGAGRVA